MNKNYTRQSFQEVVEMALAGREKLEIKTKSYSSDKKIGKDARFTITSESLNKLNALSSKHNYKRSLVLRCAIDILFYKAQNMSHDKFCKIIHIEYLKQSISNASIGSSEKQQMLKSLEYMEA